MAATLLLLTACMPSLGRPDLLTFIADGRTTRDEAILSLGEPAAAFEEGRILCFRLGRDDGGDFLLGRGNGFAGVRNSLVLVFDDRGVLSRHSLVQVKAP